LKAHDTDNIKGSGITFQSEVPVESHAVTVPQSTENIEIQQD
jgi:hypothetical protein